jgi:hypothetical protein
MAVLFLGMARRAVKKVRGLMRRNATGVEAAAWGNASADGAV